MEFWGVLDKKRPGKQGDKTNKNIVKPFQEVQRSPNGNVVVTYLNVEWLPLFYWKHCQLKKYNTLFIIISYC